MAQYLLKDGKVKQVLQVRPHASHQIAFILKVETPCKRTVSGIATRHGGDPEIDEDENGVAYPAEEFAYKGRDGLELWIRLDVEKHLHARLKVLDTRGACRFSEDLMQHVSAVQ